MAVEEPRESEASSLHTSSSPVLPFPTPPPAPNPEPVVEKNVQAILRNTGLCSPLFQTTAIYCISHYFCSSGWGSQEEDCRFGYEQLRICSFITLFSDAVPKATFLNAHRNQAMVSYDVLNTLTFCVCLCVFFYLFDRGRAIFRSWQGKKLGTRASKAIHFTFNEVIFFIRFFCYHFSITFSLDIPA